MDDIVNIAQGSDNGVSSTETAAYEEQPSTDETSEEEEEEINVTDCDDEDIANMDNNDENIATNAVGHSSKKKESSKIKSEMSAFLPPMQHWGWYGKEYRRTKGKHFYKSIQREREEREIIRVGDCVVFLTTGKPYIGQIDLLWESSGKMIVNVRWYYHPEECGYSPSNFEYPGALFDSTHTDENDVQTISHRCNILTLKDFKEYIEQDPQNYQTFYENNDLFYMAGFYDTRTKSITIDPAIRLKKSE